MIYFGTDGIRRRGNFFTTEFLEKIADATSALPDCSFVAVGRDTRTSGFFIEKTLAAALTKRGITVAVLGIVPSPCLALCTRELGCDYGIMITASHNPPEYNGIKFFSASGAKIDEYTEILIEKYITEPPVLSQKNGKLIYPDAKEIYLKHAKIVPALNNARILLDCAYGAAGRFAATVFRAAGARVVAYCDDLAAGSKINLNCGSTYASLLTSLSDEFDFVFSFDGDADRVIGIKKGKIYDGDRLLFCLSRLMNEKGKLRNSVVCGTVMTNMGVENAYSEAKIKLIRSSVGDREVFSSMQSSNLNLGGEKSGHVIFSDVLSTGDGIMTALFTAAADCRIPIEEIDTVIEFPSRCSELSVTPVQADAFRKKFGNGIIKTENGVRYVVRASGTEPKIRFLTESADEFLAEESLKSVMKTVSEFIYDN